MAGPWLSDPEMLQAVADLLKKDIAALPDYWPRIAAESNRAAADDVAQILLGRGYTAAQVDSWPMNRTFNRDLGLFWALTKGGGLADYSDLFIAKLDRRKELQTLTLLIGSVAVPPGNGDLGAAGGRISEDGFRFNMDTEF